MMAEPITESQAVALAWEYAGGLLQIVAVVAVALLGFSLLRTIGSGR